MIPRDLKVSHGVLFPAVSARTRYDVIATTRDPETELASGVPTDIGDATIIQTGVNTLTIKPITYNSSNFGTLPANITVSKRDGFNALTRKKGIFLFQFLAVLVELHLLDLL